MEASVGLMEELHNHSSVFECFSHVKNLIFTSENEIDPRTEILGVW